MAIEICRREKEGKKEPTRTFSKQQEIDVAKATGGKITPNSGATMFGGKGDVLTKQFLIEVKTKTTHSKSIMIKKDWFEKNNQEKSFMGREHSALVFNFGPNEENHYIIDEYLFQYLIEKLNEEKESI